MALEDETPLPLGTLAQARLVDEDGEARHDRDLHVGRMRLDRQRREYRASGRIAVNFEPGRKYSRPDVKAVAGLSRAAKGGNWDTGVLEHGGEFIIFANVGTEGRTGHNYGNRWEGECLRWYHKGGSHLGWSSVRRLLQQDSTRHVFWRPSNHEPFTYAGRAKTLEIFDTSPVELLWSFVVDDLPEPPIQSPEEVPRGDYREGAVRQVLMNAYERDRAARDACIRHFGLACGACALRFDDRYGPLGAGFIHVHHVVPLSDLGPNYALNPLEDLRPVCANCHAMLHRQRPPLSIDALRALLTSRAEPSSLALASPLSSSSPPFARAGP